MSYKNGKMSTVSLFGVETIRFSVIVIEISLNWLIIFWSRVTDFRKCYLIVKNMPEILIGAFSCELSGRKTNFQLWTRDHYRILQFRYWNFQPFYRIFMNYFVHSGFVSYVGIRWPSLQLFCCWFALNFAVGQLYFWFSAVKLCIGPTRVF